MAPAGRAIPEGATASDAIPFAAHAAKGLTLYKILFHLKALLWESIILSLPPHLQSQPDYNTLTRLLRNIRRHPDSPFVCHTQNHIGNGNILCRSRLKGLGPYHSNHSFVTLQNQRPTLLRAPAYRTPSEASPRRRCSHASRVSGALAIIRHFAIQWLTSARVENLPILKANWGVVNSQAAYNAPRSTHISRYMRRWIPVPLITADLFRRVVLSPDMQPRGRGFDSRSVTFPPPGFDMGAVHTGRGHDGRRYSICGARGAQAG